MELLRRNETSEFMKLLFVVIQRLTYAVAWYGAVEKYRKIVKIRRAMFQRGATFLTGF